MPLKKGQHKKVFEKIQREGYVRVRVDGEVFDLSEVPELEKAELMPAKWQILIELSQQLIIKQQET